ncbi:MAG: NADPH:quinone reductase [Mycobacterium sp.]|nr:NADPH:quinone reductase [Mycobacterium sp.]MBV9720655.1 NADPH:quinone reductase [Mycobacterium sp.]
MIAAWYDRQGPAIEVLQVGELPTPEPGPGEVRVRVTLSGINPGDTKKRAGWQGTRMSFPRIIPHSDGAGVIDAVGDGVDTNRVGQRVWTYGAQSYRPFGTAAQMTCVPAPQAVPLPAEVSDEIGACLGIPGITAHRAIFSDGAVADKTILVHGVLGSVSSLAAQLAHWGGATVIGTVVHSGDLDNVDTSVVSHPVALDATDPAAAIREHAPGGVDRIVEVGLSDNADLDAAVVANEAVIAAYASHADRPEIPFWPLLFANITLRLLGSDDFSPDAKQQAGADLTAAARVGALNIPLAAPHPLAEIAAAHDHVDKGPRNGRVLLAIPG